ncbi:14268_t:CDS:2 [Funneliformis geosporum]|uniref:14268_t:CDS:1 n=1 Tax=Funneliformis geosporum TaxID=1117311 RepID=A0A9W4SPH6_9GLOM|nr:14268_t:CDS:2 [Funneliformis geosporum]
MNTQLARQQEDYLASGFRREETVKPPGGRTYRDKNMITNIN